MARNKHPTFSPPAPAREVKPLVNLERVRPVYFFTPDLEREVNKLDGVTSARVLSTGTEIDEIHVIAPRDRTPKKVVRDIESLLLVRFGVRIDHRKISVVQTGAEPAPSPVPSRPQIQKVGLTAAGESNAVHVEINVDGHSIEGVGEYSGQESNLHASSRALINAIEKLLNTQGALALQDVSVVEVSARKVMLAVLTWTIEGHEEILVGATVARGEPLEDAARATFDAVNRKLVRITPVKRARA
jgi:hypothetical protein